MTTTSDINIHTDNTFGSFSICSPLIMKQYHVVNHEYMDDLYRIVSNATVSNLIDFNENPRIESTENYYYNQKVCIRVRMKPGVNQLSFIPFKNTYRPQIEFHANHLYTDLTIGDDISSNNGNRWLMTLIKLTLPRPLCTNFANDYIRSRDHCVNQLKRKLAFCPGTMMTFYNHSKAMHTIRHGMTSSTKVKI